MLPVSDEIITLDCWSWVNGLGLGFGSWLIVISIDPVVVDNESVSKSEYVPSIESVVLFIVTCRLSLSWSLHSGSSSMDS